MQRLAVILVVVACNDAQPRLEPVRNVTSFEMSTKRRGERWHELAPTGVTYGDVVARIPNPERAPMAFALVREGGTTCPRTINECGMESIDGPRDDEGIDAPCLRRRLVEYIVANEERLAIPADVLATIAKSKDAEMAHTIARVLDDKAVVEFLVAVEAAGTTSPYGSLVGRPREVIADAARRHVDAAIPELSTYEERDRDLVTSAIADTAIAPDTRAGLLLGLDIENHRSPAMIAALRSAVAESHCELSARAAEGLAKLGDSSRLPRAPGTRDTKAFFHEACRLVGGDFWDDSSTLAATFIAKRGLVVNAPKGEAFADSTRPTRRTITTDEYSEVIPFLRMLVHAKCDDAVCIDETTRYELGWSGNVLAKVTIRRDLAKEKTVIERADASACDPGGGD